MAHAEKAVDEAVEPPVFDAYAGALQRFGVCVSFIAQGVVLRGGHDGRSELGQILRPQGCDPRVGTECGGGGIGAADSDVLLEEPVQFRGGEEVAFAVLDPRRVRAAMSVLG